MQVFGKTTPKLLILLSGGRKCYLVHILCHLSATVKGLDAMRYSSHIALLNIALMALLEFIWLAGVCRLLLGENFIEYPMLFSILCSLVFVSTLIVLFCSQWWIKRMLQACVICDYTNEAFSSVAQILYQQAASLKIPKPVLHIYDSKLPNAFIVGGIWRHQHIYLSRALVMQLSQDEIEAVIAHELAHIYHQDILINEVFFGMGMACLHLIQHAVGGLLAFSGKQHSHTEIAKKIAMVLTYGGLLLPVWLLMLLYSRRSEYRADALASQMVGYQQFLWLLHRLKGVCRDSFFNLDEQQILLRQYFTTHPPLDHRINAIETRQQA